MDKKVSMKLIADELGISKNTVSLALRGMPGISSETRQKIILTADQLGYQYKKANVVTKNICLILSKSIRKSFGFFNYVQFGMEDEGKKEGVNLIIHYYMQNEKEVRIPLSIKEGMISGIITLGHISYDALKPLLDLHLPIVMVDHYLYNVGIDYILTDNYSGGYRATEYLIKKGHKKIGFLGDIYCSTSFKDRYLGFKKALEDYNMEINRDYLYTKISIEALALEEDPSVFEMFNEISKLPDALFCCNDAEAIAANRMFSSFGIKVPEDISIIGFDDIEFSMSMSPELTTMKVEKELMGRKAVEKLVSIMNNPTTIAEKLLLNTTLVERNSVKSM
ncbi:MAG TPA: LacI family DNA-binding transcriptional regulator [Clostridiaceae bacterium]